MRDLGAFTGNVTEEVTCQAQVLKHYDVAHILQRNVAIRRYRLAWTLTVTVCTMRIELSTGIAALNVQGGQIASPYKFPGRNEISTCRG